MATKIRLARGGAKKKPYYRIVVADSRSARDGKFIERIGSYNPMLAKDDANRVQFKEDRLNYWLSTGAEYSDRIAFFLKSKGVDVTAIRKKAATPAAKKPTAAPKAKQKKSA
jgi:small subunit ribosomal protein S16